MGLMKGCLKIPKHFFFNVENNPLSLICFLKNTQEISMPKVNVKLTQVFKSNFDKPDDL